jgi:hypothetical protein
VASFYAYGSVVQNLIDELPRKQLKVGAVWATSLEGTEEKNDEKQVSIVCGKYCSTIRAKYNDVKLNSRQDHTVSLQRLYHHLSECGYTRSNMAVWILEA